MAFLSPLRRILWLGTILYAAAMLVLGMWPSAEDLPWTPLDLDQPAGPFTATKLSQLAGDPARCRRLLTAADVAFTAAPPRGAGGECAVLDGIIRTGGARQPLSYAPSRPLLACPLAAALVMWERQVVQPAAARLLHSRVTRIDHYGSYACRRLAGGEGRAWSEHARAAAIDIAGFRLADGRRITVARDWMGEGEPAAFLHAVRDGACRLFATTLSPDYNRAHRDHFHLDEARRGGWSACR